MEVSKALQATITIREKKVDDLIMVFTNEENEEKEDDSEEKDPRSKEKLDNSEE